MSKGTITEGRGFIIESFWTFQPQTVDKCLCHRLCCWLMWLLELLFIFLYNYRHGATGAKGRGATVGGEAEAGLWGLPNPWPPVLHTPLSLHVWWLAGRLNSHCSTKGKAFPSTRCGSEISSRTEPMRKEVWLGKFDLDETFPAPLLQSDFSRKVLAT